MNLNGPPYLKSISLKRNDIEDFAQYPFAIPAVRELYSLSFTNNVTFLVGENGSGKSTLLEAIAVGLGFNPEGGSKNFNFETRGSHSDLHQYLRFAQSFTKPKDGFFLRAESYFNLASNIETLDEEEQGGSKIINAYGGVSLHEQSHGESFLALMMHRLWGKGLYLLDEPEAALSPMRQLSIMERMKTLLEKDSQFIIATHSPILLAYPGATIYQIGESGIEEVAYEDTEHYQVTKLFLDNPQRMLVNLFAP